MSISVLKPETTSALILGVSECPQAPSLQSLPQCSNSAEDFERYLRERLELPQTHILNLFNSNDSSSEQLDKIDEWLKSATKAGHATDLLVYYTGHGAFSGGDQSYILAVRRTKQGLEGATSIRYSDLAFCIKQQAPRARRYLILDCCFAASAVPRHQSNLSQVVIRKVEDELPPSGTALLCSSSARLVSIAPEGKRHTMFSGALLECLNEGVLGGAKSLSLEDVGNRAREIIQEEYPSDAVRPELHVPEQQKGNPARIPLFPNKLYKEAAQAAAATQTHTFKPEMPVRVSPRVIGLISGIISSISVVLAPYPFGGPDWSPFGGLSWKAGGFYPPILPAICLTIALFVSADRLLRPSQLFGIAIAVWTSWTLAYNTVLFSLYIPFFALHVFDISLPILYGPAAFIGAFCLNIGLDALVDRRKLTRGILKYHAVRCLPFPLLGWASGFAAVYASEPPHSVWASLALYVSWQLFMVEKRGSSSKEGREGYFGRRPSQLLARMAAALAFIVAVCNFGAKSALQVRRLLSADPIVFAIKSVTITERQEKTEKIRLVYMIAKTANRPMRCRLEIDPHQPTNPFSTSGSLIILEDTFTDAKADFFIPSSWSSLSVRQYCVIPNAQAFESDWTSVDLTRLLVREDGR